MTNELVGFHIQGDNVVWADGCYRPATPEEHAMWLWILWAKDEFQKLRAAEPKAGLNPHPGAQAEFMNSPLPKPVWPGGAEGYHSYPLQPGMVYWSCHHRAKPLPHPCEQCSAERTT